MMMNLGHTILHRQLTLVATARGMLTLHTLRPLPRLLSSQRQEHHGAARIL